MAGTLLQGCGDDTTSLVHGQLSSERFNLEGARAVAVARDGQVWLADVALDGTFEVEVPTEVQFSLRFARSTERGDLYDVFAVLVTETGGATTHQWFSVPAGVGVVDLGLVAPTQFGRVQSALSKGARRHSRDGVSEGDDDDDDEGGDGVSEGDDDDDDEGGDGVSEGDDDDDEGGDGVSEGDDDDDEGDGDGCLPDGDGDDRPGKHASGEVSVCAVGGGAGYVEVKAQNAEALQPVVDAEMSALVEVACGGAGVATDILRSGEDRTGRERGGDRHGKSDDDGNESDDDDDEGAKRCPDV